MKLAFLKPGATAWKRRTAGVRAARRLLSVGVLVDLFRRPSSGGHVKCWERLAEAARGEPVDLTVYFLGERREVVRVSENVRFQSLKPLVGTRSFSFLSHLVDHTDLAPLSPRLPGLLRRHQVIHTTGAHFALCRTAKLFARATGRALVNSIHTDIPGFTRVHSEEILGRLAAASRLVRWVQERWRLQEWLGRRMQRTLFRHLRRCDWVLASRPGDVEGDEESVPPGRFSILRRGIDKEHFNPSRRDRIRLEERFGIGRDRRVVLFVGRLDRSKNVSTLVQAAGILLDRSLPFHLLMAGEGNQGEEVRAVLGERVTLPGWLSYADLGWVYASSDLFVFPSEIEISPNVVLEAKASGLPVLVSAKGGSANMVRASGRDAIELEDSDPRRWAEAIAALLTDRDRRACMGESARRQIEEEWPSWREVLREDLLPVWRFVARGRGLWTSTELKVES